MTRVTGLGIAGAWAVLMGDAAHSVYPATGEGVNSSLEDAVYLLRSLQSPEGIAAYPEDRLADSQALSDLAYAVSRGSGKSAMQSSVLGILKKLRVVGMTKDDMLFGARSDVILPYHAIVEKWKSQTWWLGGAPACPISG